MWTTVETASISLEIPLQNREGANRRRKLVLRPYRKLTGFRGPVAILTNRSVSGAGTFRDRRRLQAPAPADSRYLLPFTAD
jgi:hypothetical protein